MSENAMPPLDLHFRIAMDSRGQVFLAAEQALIEAGPAAKEFIEEQLPASTASERAIAEIILERIDGNATYQAVLDYFDDVEARLAPTAVRVPPPEGVANFLEQNFGDSAAPFLQIYVLKLWPGWVDWKTLGSLLYMGKLKGSQVAATLLRFIRETSHDHYRKIALDALISSGDQVTKDLIQAEIQQLDQRHQLLIAASDQL